MGLASALAESETHASKAVEVVASRSACAREMDTGGHRLAFGIGGVHAIDPKDLADIPSFADKVRSRHASLRAPHARDRRLRADLVLPPLFRTREAKILHAAFRSPAPARHRLTLPGPEHVPSQMSLDQTDDAIDPVDATGNQRTPLTKSRPGGRARESQQRVQPFGRESSYSLANSVTEPSLQNIGGSVTPSPIVRRDADVAASAGGDVEVGVSVSFVHGDRRRLELASPQTPSPARSHPASPRKVPACFPRPARMGPLRRRVRAPLAAHRRGALDKARAPTPPASRSEAEREPPRPRASGSRARRLGRARLHGSLDFPRGEPGTRPPRNWRRRHAPAEAESARGRRQALRRAGDAAAAGSGGERGSGSLSLEAAQARFARRRSPGRRGRARGADAADAARAGGRRRPWRDAGAPPSERDAAPRSRRLPSDAEAARGRETATASEEEGVRHNTRLRARARAGGGEGGRWRRYALRVPRLRHSRR